MAKYINSCGLDPAIAAVIEADPYEKVGDISVTGLLRPTQIAGLELQHEEDMVEDVCDGLWRLLGRAMHYVISTAEIAGALQEHRLVIPVLGWDVSGTWDILYTDRHVLKDYKLTSVWSYIYGHKEWEQQVNMYVYMARKHGIQVDEAKVAVLMRDWSVGEMWQNQDYPRKPFAEIDIPIWAEAKAETFLHNRVLLHQHARNYGQYEPCTDDERWAKQTRWALIKPGAKKAWLVFDTQEETESHWKPGYDIVERPGRNIRCESYCPVRRWCKQADELGVPNRYAHKPGGVVLDSLR